MQVLLLVLYFFDHVCVSILHVLWQEFVEDSVQDLFENFPVAAKQLNSTHLKQMIDELGLELEFRHMEVVDHVHIESANISISKEHHEYESGLIQKLVRQILVRLDPCA